jgi:hypothetical protein
MSKFKPTYGDLISILYDVLRITSETTDTTEDRMKKIKRLVLEILPD